MSITLHQFRVFSCVRRGRQAGRTCFLRPRIHRRRRYHDAMSREPVVAHVEVSVVIPVCDEQESIAPLCARLSHALRESSASYEIIFVDDGSRDETVARIADQQTAHPEIRLLRLSRNFG
ncbi:MAG: glycosyltransferase, partial [Planctomycetota bacterium]